jgi:hypothetical protein
MTRLPPGRREVYPSKRARGTRRAPSLGPRLNVSVPISFGLPLIVVGLALLVAALRTGDAIYWISGGVLGALGIALVGSGKRL